MSINYTKMLGLTTPPKKKPQATTDQTKRAGPSTKTSIGEYEYVWDSGKKEPQQKQRLQPPTPPKKATITAREPKPKTSAASPPPKTVTPVDRTLEGGACLRKAKTCLHASRNLKSEIKVEVEQAINRMYALLRDAEVELEEKREREEKKQQQPRKKGGLMDTKGNQTDTIIPESIPEGTRQAEILKDHKCIQTDITTPELLPAAKGKQEINTTEIQKILDNHGELIKENTKRMEQLQVTIGQQIEQAKTTYASVVASQPTNRPSITTALHSVVVSSNNEAETGEDVLNRIRKVVNARDGGVEIERIRKAKDQKVIVGCRTEEERQKVKERLKRAEDHLTVQDVKNKNPLVALKGVFSYNTDEDILNALRSQNEHILHNLQDEDTKMEIAYRKRTRNPHVGHVIMRVSPKVWQRMIDSETVRIDLQKVRVTDQSPLVQCSKCLGYGHGRRFCMEEEEVCSHCGGSHMRARCADWLAGSPPQCRNCKRTKMDKIEHNAFSNECPVRRKWEALARATIAYC